jgi:putative phosphoesterase
MKGLVGVISDTHDNLGKVRAAVALFNRAGVERVVHCGDVVAQFVFVEMARLNAPVTAVYGNCDGDRAALAGRAVEFGFELHEGPHKFEFAGRRFLVSHKPVADAGDCDYCLSGHTHRPEHRAGRPTFINPGEAGGWLSGRSTVVLLDGRSGAVEFVDI